MYGIFFVLPLSFKYQLFQDIVAPSNDTGEVTENAEISVLRTDAPYFDFAARTEVLETPCTRYLDMRSWVSRER